MSAPVQSKAFCILAVDPGLTGALALRLWPSRSDLFGRKKDHGRAEAALLARYGAELIMNKGERNV
jgi:crossover junction endodeoxyribonuclease RuvC